MKLKKGWYREGGCEEKGEGEMVIVICVAEYENPCDKAIVSPTHVSFQLINPVKPVQPTSMLVLSALYESSIIMCILSF